jgi:hypothetical protein
MRLQRKRWSETGSRFDASSAETEKQSIRDFFHKAEQELRPETFKYFLFFNCENKDELFDDGTNMLHVIVTRYGNLKLTMAAVEDGKLQTNGIEV